MIVLFLNYQRVVTLYIEFVCLASAYCFPSLVYRLFGCFTTQLFRATSCIIIIASYHVLVLLLRQSSPTAIASVATPLRAATWRDGSYYMQINGKHRRTSPQTRKRSWKKEAIFEVGKLYETLGNFAIKIHLCQWLFGSADMRCATLFYNVLRRSPTNVPLKSSFLSRRWYEGSQWPWQIAGAHL